MAATQWPFLAAVLLLLSSGLHCSSSLPTCPQSCTCQSATLLNCSSSGLSSVPQLIQDSVTELDLSHNLLDSVTLHRPHRNLRNVWLGNNTIALLSLCIERNLDGKYLRGRRRLRPRSREGCVPWAPTLQLLSVERNLLEQLPEGLEGVKSLQVLQLSFNRISTLRPEDLSHLQQLKELDLKHNLITSLHPQMFQDLIQLKVLDLSFNMLTSLHPLTYFSLHNIGADVRMVGNRWKCDCSMRSLRRQMAYDSSRGLQTWKMVCAFPSTLSGRDLLQLEEDDLNCFSTEISPEIHRDVTVYSGSEILLSCSAEDSVWWTPNGQASVSHLQAGLLISDITEKETGLYVCVSEENQVVSVFNLQISQIGSAKRKPRSAPNISRPMIPQGTLNTIGELRNQSITQSDLALAVCLSILFTFLIAFIIGVLARPCIDILWKKVTVKKRSTETHVVSSVEQRQYDNEAYSIGEEQEPAESFRERRVTFSDVNCREERNVQYYDTVAGGDQESISNDEVFDGEAVGAMRVKRTAGDSGSESSSLQSTQGDKQNDGRDLSGEPNADRKHNMQFEHIPDRIELQERRSLSSSSDSSLSEKEVNHKTLKSSKVVVDSLQQKSDLPTKGKVEVPQISTEGRCEIHGFSSEPFAEWSPHTNSTDLGVLQENEELFEFSDSVQSTSARSSSVFDSFNDPKLTVAPTSHKQKGDDTSTSSSSSHVSEHEDVSKKIKPMPRTKLRGVGLAVASLSKSVDTNAPSPLARHSSSSNSESEAEVTDRKGNPKKGRVSLKKMTLDTSAPLPASGSSSSSDSEEETTKHIRKQEQGDVHKSRAPIKVSQTVSREPETQRPAIYLEHTTSLKKHLDIKTPLPASNSSSSSDSEDETTGQKKKQGDVHVTQLPMKGSQTVSHEPETRKPALDLEHTTSIKRQLDIRAPSASSDSSSSSDSEEETIKSIKKQEQGDVYMSKAPIKVSQTLSHDTGTQRRDIDLEYTTSIKRHPDIKAPSASSDSSSSSDSDNETTSHTEKQRPGKFNTAWLPLQGSQTKSPEARWPTLDLQHIPHIKRRLDIKVPSPTSDSSSSSDSEEETKNSIKTEKQGDVHMSKAPKEVSQTVSHEPGTQRPLLDLEHTTFVKRHPDIKAPSASSDSSPSSDSEEETTKHVKRQEQQPPVKVSQSLSHEPQTRRPALDLEHTTSIKTQLDVKAPSASSDSSSSSGSDDEAAGHMDKQRPGQLITTGVPLQGSQTKSHEPDAKWPSLELQHIPRIKRRLDIKAPSPASDSSSSSDSEEETTKHVKRQEQQLPVKVSQRLSHEPQTRRPALDLKHTTSIKTQLDVKAPSASSDSSSSSGSDDEAAGHMDKQRPGQLITTGVPLQGSQTKSHDPDAKWPSLELQHIPRIKRRLDIKAPSPASDSSSSSDSEEETTKHVKRQEQQPPVKVSQRLSHEPQTRRPALDLEHTTSIKTQLDVKAPSASSDSSSSSDSDDETTGHTEKQRPGKMNTTGLLLQGFKTKSHDPDAKWPSLDLRHIPRLKRRLDIKAPSASSDSSSSSDSEEETTVHIKKQRPESLNTAGLLLQEPQTKSLDPNARWPTLDLLHIPRPKRRLDIKAPSEASDSSSSSDSEDETIKSIKKWEQGGVQMPRPPIKVSQTVSHDPGTQSLLLDLKDTSSIKRQPGIKEPSPASDSSSSSDSEEETTYVEKQEQGKLHLSSPPIKVSPTVSHEPETRWPLLDLERTTPIKRRLDIKAPSPASDSSSSSDSEDETIKSIKKQEQGGVQMPRPPIKVSQTVSHEPETRWPLLDLERTTSIKRRLDIKAPSPASDSSSSSDSEVETTKLTKKQEQHPSIKVSPTVSLEPRTQRPATDLQYTTSIKKHPDIKSPSASSDSSSSSDSEEETIHIKKQEQGELHLSRPPNKVSPTVSHEPETRWPLLDLERTTSVKRRLDIKAPLQASDSSSSSDSEVETTKHIKKQEQQPSIEVSQTLSHEPGTQRPTIKLQQTTSITRHPDVKAPSASSDSPSSSDSEDETIKSIKKREQGGVQMPRPPIKVSPTVSHEPETRWPLLDLERTTSVKRRLDIKAPLQASDSSSSSDSEVETTKHIKKQEQQPSIEVSQTLSHEPETRWPLLDLERTTSVKRRLDIKAPSPASDSSSSSDSEEETTKHVKRWEPQTRRLALDLEHTTSIKRQLDVNAPSASSDSSSSTDSDEETIKSIKKQEQGDVHMPRPPSKVFPIVSHKSETQRPALDLEYATSIKRQLDVKAPSASSDSSSSSDSDDETAGHMDKERPGKLITRGLPLQGSQTKSHEPDTKWPGLELRHIPRIKRRLDIKAPSPASDSSSSSDSEEETTHMKKQDQGELHLSRPPHEISPTVSQETRRPLLDLERTTSTKRRLDIKAPSASSDSSSSSDNEEETIKHVKRQEQQPPVKVSQRLSHEPQTRRPALDLEHTTSIKRELDVKAPSASSDSSSSSNSDDEAAGHMDKERPGKLITRGLPLQGSQTKSHDPDTKWPGLELRHIPRIKRRLDIKAPSPASDSYSSSDSEEETTHIKKQEQGELHLSRPANEISPTVSQETRRPLLDLERTTSTKRRLDIKAPSASSDSSSSSDNEEETIKHVKRQEQQPPVKVSQRLSREPRTRRPALDLEHTTSIKRELDVKAPSASSDSSSSSNSDDEAAGHMDKERPGKLITRGLPLQGSQTKSHDPDTKWPGLELRHIPRIKRRLDIKAPSPASDSYSSSDSEEETTHIKKQEQGELHLSRPAYEISPTVSQETRRPLLDLERTTSTKRRLDIKAPSASSDSSSSSDNEEETTKHVKRQEQQPPVKVSQRLSHEPQTRRRALDLEHTTSIKRQQDVKAPSASSDSSSSSDSDDETAGHMDKERPGKLITTSLPFQGSQTKSHDPDTKWPGLELRHIPRIKRHLDIKAPSPASDSSSSSDNEEETTKHVKRWEQQSPVKVSQRLSHESQTRKPALDLEHTTSIKRQFDVKAPSASNSSASESENVNRHYKAKVGMGVSVTPKASEKDLMSFPKAPLGNISHNPKTEHNIELINYTAVSDDMGNKSRNDNIYKTPEISPELESRWATMNLSLSRNRKRLESTLQRQKSSDLPSSPCPDSPSYSSESGPGSPISRTRLKKQNVGMTIPGSSLIHDNKPVNASPTLKNQSDTMFDFGAPHNWKYLDVSVSTKAPTTSQQQPDSSSSSSSENEMVDHKAPDLSLDIPRIKRRLNIKAPSPKPSSSSSSSSESEKEVQKYSEKQSRSASNMTDIDSTITYNRVIMKTSSLPGNSLYQSGKSQTVDHTNAPTSSVRAPSMSFDKIIKRRIQQSQRKTDLDFPPELLWTGVGHHPSDLSISTPNLNTVSPQPASPAQPKLPTSYQSSSKSDIKIQQDSGKSDVTILHKDSSLSANPVSTTSRGALHKFMNLPSNTYETSRVVTEDRRERKGLSALKEMALERKKWDNEDLNKGAFSSSDNHGQQSDTSFDYRRSESDIRALSKQPLTHLPSASIIERRATDLSYGVSHYRSHNVRQPSQAAPHAIPETTPPSYEAAWLTQRSPQSTDKHAWDGNISYQQQRKSSEGSDTSSENSNSLDFDYSNAISHV